MNTPSRLIVVDTNVWLDYYLGDRRGHNAARRFIDTALRSSAELLYSPMGSKDLYYLVAQHLKTVFRVDHDGVLTQEGAAAAKEVAWACLENLTEIATAVGCDQSDVWVAARQRPLHDDYEDNLVIAAALRANALLVTNDERLRAHCPAAAMSVRDATTYLQSNGPGER